MASRGSNLIAKEEVISIYSGLLNKVEFVEAQPNESIQEILESYESELIPGVHVHFNGKYIWLSDLDKKKFYRTGKTIENMLSVNSAYSNVLRISRKHLIEEVERDSKNYYNNQEQILNHEQKVS